MSEKIGNYTVRPMLNGNYSVSVNNGNYGAKVCTPEEIDELRNRTHEKPTSANRFDRIIKSYAYELDASDNIFAKISNTVRLQQTTGLSGFDLFSARVHNAFAMNYNPFALTEFIRQGFQI